MGDFAAAYNRLIERFVAWAGGQEDVRAAVILGSRARTETPADEWSDLDLLIYTTDPRRYVADTGWLGNLGPVWFRFLEPEPTRDTIEFSVLFDGGLDVDFVLIHSDMPRDLAGSRLDPDLMAAMSRGFHFVLDKGGFTDALRSLSSPPVKHEPPSEGAFLNVVNDFWYRCVWVAKKLRRGEIWTARDGLDRYIRLCCLLPMIEWHAKTVHGWDYDTWYRGRFIETWADPRVARRLRETSSRHDADDVRRALIATMDLLRRLANETAERLGYPYPAEADAKVTAWVAGCLSKG